MGDEVCLRTDVQRQQPGYVEGFFLFNPAANILLLAVEPTAVPGSARLSVLFTPCVCVTIVCFGSAPDRFLPYTLAQSKNSGSNLLMKVHH